MAVRLHPRLRVTDQSVEIINPFRRYSFEWDDITVIAPGENGLLIGSEDSAAEAWCVQKSNSASRRGRLTRADRIANQLLDIVELHDPPVQRMRRPGSVSAAPVLTRAACLPGWNVQRARRRWPLSFRRRSILIRPPRSPRWQRVLGDRLMHTYLLEVDSPVGYVAFNGDTVHHLGVVPDHQRRGYGSALVEFACMEIYAAGAREAFCWVLVENHTARAFFAPAVGVRPASGEGRSTRRILNHCR